MRIRLREDKVLVEYLDGLKNSAEKVWMTHALQPGLSTPQMEEAKVNLRVITHLYTMLLGDNHAKER